MVQRQELSARWLENPDCDHHEKDFIVIIIISPVAPEILAPLGNGACNKKSVSGTGHMYSFRNGIPILFIQNRCLSDPELYFNRMPSVIYLAIFRM